MKPDNDLKKNKLVTAHKIYKYCDEELYSKLLNLPTINELENLKWNYVLKYIIVNYHDFEKAYIIKYNHDKLEEVINYLHKHSRKRKLVNDKTKKELKEFKSHKYYIDFYDCFKNDDKTLLRIISDHINDLVFCNLDNAKYVYSIIENMCIKHIKPLNIYDNFVEFKKEDIENIKLVKDNNQLDSNVLIFLFIFNLINPNNIKNEVLIYPKYKFSDGCIVNNFNFLDTIIKTIKNKGFVGLDTSILQETELKRYNKLLDLLIN